MIAKSSDEQSGKIQLVVADAHPTVKPPAGKKFEVRAISVLDANLEGGKKVAARLCGGTDTCVA